MSSGALGDFSTRGSSNAAQAAQTFSAAQSGEARAIARMLSWAERDTYPLRSLGAQLSRSPGSDTPQSYVLGVTGAAGVGKSSCTAELISAWRARDARVAVLAVDPSSPLTGGALLGDRVRMQQHAGDPGVFIRSLASRGRLGGLSAAVPEALRVLEAVGFDVVIIETVGVGQAEVEVAKLADTTLVLVAPGMGDGIQSVKAGILEIADVFVVNKADHAGADSAVRDLKNLLALGGNHSQPGAWRPRVVSTVATTGKGIDEVMAAAVAHWEWSQRCGEWQRRRTARAAVQLESLVLEELRLRSSDGTADTGLLERLADAVARGERDPYEAAAALLAGQ
ncbi:MAG: methylmalonyl Co-A mutase-associated GTPase MeaB [Mycobacteriales bacterium]